MQYTFNRCSRKHGKVSIRRQIQESKFERTNACQQMGKMGNLMSLPYADDRNRNKKRNTPVECSKESNQCTMTKGRDT